jgi:uncharacterized protein (TIGR02594 family)
MTCFQMAERFVGEIKERPGQLDHPFIVWCHFLSGLSDVHDEVPWCSSFVNGIAWLLRMPRSKSARARSWLDVGHAIDLAHARPENDVIILRRGTDPNAGHVGFFAGFAGGHIHVLGGNQSNNVTIAPFVVPDLLGVRRLDA